jgi:radical SAM/Cys-rich protein
MCFAHRDPACVALLPLFGKAIGSRGEICNGHQGAVQVRVVASMPCYSKENVDSQRGGGVFRRSIAGLQMLNAAGYGHPGSGLTLDLVYNPSGAFLAPAQATLEAAYKQELQEGYGIEFNSLLCLNNMPIKRFWEYLQRRGQLEDYTRLLVSNLNPSTGEHVMCRDTVSVSWDGQMCAFSAQHMTFVSGSSACGRNVVACTLVCHCN